MRADGRVKKLLSVSLPGLKARIHDGPEEIHCASHENVPPRCLIAEGDLDQGQSVGTEVHHYLC